MNNTNKDTIINFFKVLILEDKQRAWDLANYPLQCLKDIRSERLRVYLCHYFPLHFVPVRRSLSQIKEELTAEEKEQAKEEEIALKPIISFARLVIFNLSVDFLAADDFLFESKSKSDKKDHWIYIEKLQALIEEHDLEVKKFPWL